ncbi:MAG: ComEC/Rec2 family competence protein [Thermoleophilia bacterium]
MAAAVHRRAPARLRFAPHAVLAAFCAGLAADLAVAVPVAPAAAATGAAGLAAAWLARGGRAAPALAALAATATLAGLAWGGARLEATAPPRLDLPARASGTVVVDAPAAPDGRGGSRVRARAERLRVEDGSEVPAGAGVLLDLDDAPAGAPALGTRLRVTGRLRPAAGPTAPSWWAGWLERQGIAARMSPEAMRPQGRRGGLAGLRDRWRVWAGRNAGAGLSGDVAVLVRGMALGGATGLSEDAEDAFRDSGLWHLLAVSGQNVTVVALAAMALLAALGVGRRARVAAAAAVMTAYCLACDGGASVARAGIVGGLGLAAELLAAPRERWYLLLAGLAAILAHQPRALHDPGLQLSFAAVAGLFAIAPVLAARLRGWLPGRVADLAAMAAAAGLATAPVLVWHFGRLSLAGLLLNVAAVPVAAPVVVLALAGIAAGAVLPAAGVALAWPAGAGAALLLGAARLAAAVPGAAVDLPGWVAVALLAPAAAPVLAERLREPGAAARARALPWRALATLAAALVAAGWVLPRPGPPPPWPASPALTTLDVGQGDAHLLRSPEGAAALVDAGPPAASGPSPARRALARLGVRRLDVLVLTHDSLDHLGGAADVIDHIPVGVLLAPLEPADGFPPAALRVLRAARERGVPVREYRAGTRVPVGRWSLRVLSPAVPRPAGADPNPYSMVALASAGALDVLLTADAESDALARLPLRPVEVLKVSHHGSEDPGLAPVLDRLRPAVALVPVGEGNPFRHPRADTLATLAAAGALVWRTDLSGDLTVSAPDGRVVVQPGR